jgi:prolyl-tRNA synthetase
MGSYGIGLARIMAAHQESNDEGRDLARTLAPFEVHMIVIGTPDSRQFTIAEDWMPALGDGIPVSTTVT